MMTPPSRRSEREERKSVSKGRKLRIGATIAGIGAATKTAKLTSQVTIGGERISALAKRLPMQDARVPDKSKPRAVARGFLDVLRFRDQ